MPDKTTDPSQSVGKVTALVAAVAALVVAVVKVLELPTSMGLILVALRIGVYVLVAAAITLWAFFFWEEHADDGFFKGCFGVLLFAAASCFVCYGTYWVVMILFLGKPADVSMVTSSLW